MSLNKKEKEIRRDRILDLVSIKTELLQSENPNVELSKLVLLLRWEFKPGRINKEIFHSSMWEIYSYAEDCSVFKEEKERKLASMQNYFIEKSTHISRLLKDLETNYYFKKGENFIKAFKEGSYTGKTIMDYTKWLLNVDKACPELDIDPDAFCIFEVYLGDFLMPRNFTSTVKKTDLKINTIMKYLLWLFHVFTGEKLTKYVGAIFRIPEDDITALWKPRKSKKHNLINLDYLIIRNIDNLVEYYIEVANPSDIFLSSLIVRD